MGWLSKKPAEEKTVKEGLTNIPQTPNEDAVRTSIIDQTKQSTNVIFDAANPLPEVTEQHRRITEELQKAKPDESVIKECREKIEKIYKMRIDKEMERETNRMDALNGEQEVAALKWRRDQEIVRAERAKEASKKYLSWIGALGEKGGEGIGALGEKGGKGIGKGIGGILSGTLGGIASGLAGLLWYGWKERAEEHRQKMAKLSN